MNNYDYGLYPKKKQLRLWDVRVMKLEMMQI